MMKKRLIALILIMVMLALPCVTAPVAYAEPGTTEDDALTEGMTTGTEAGTTTGTDETTTATDGTSTDTAGTTDTTATDTDDTTEDGETDDAQATTASKPEQTGDIIDTFGDLEEFAVTSTPSIASVSGIVMDVQSGAVLYQKNINERLYPASITKIMTTLVALENSSLDEVVTFSQNAVDLIQNQGASNIEIVPGEKLTMEESLYAIMLMSANEVCNGVAEHVAGDIKTFVKMMNKRAKELGCTGTHFNNTNGLWQKNHYTTAHDMALISRAAYKNPEFAKITGTKWYKLPKTNKRKAGYTLHNHHGMLLALNYPQYEYKYCVGGKTGYTSQCLYTLVTYAKKRGMTILSVIMRNPNPPYLDDNQYTDTTKLLNFGFNNFRRAKITDSEINDLNTERLFAKFNPFFNTETSSLYVEEDAGIILPKGKKLSDAEKTVEYYPAETYDEEGKRIIGRLHYSYAGKEVGGTNIYYEDRGTPVLSDSINMNQWFDEAVEKATEEPFPWLTVIIIVVIVILVGVGVFLFLPVLIQMKQNRSRTKRYRKNKKNEQMVNSVSRRGPIGFKSKNKNRRRR